MDDDDSNGHTINEDLRLMGVPGDDEEDLGEERDALRGLGSQGDPIDLAAGAGDGDGEGRGDGTGTDSNTGGTGSSCLGRCGTRQRASTSEVWNDFDKIYKMINGVNVRWKARCHHCKGLLSAHSSSGTSYLSRHRDGCLKKLGKAAMTQSHISFNPDGTPKFWEYKPDVARSEMCRLISRLDLPICIAESAAFEEYIRKAHNPRFTSVSRQTTTRDITKYFADHRAKLAESLRTNVSSIAITSDIWSGNAKEDYLSVVIHYVNSAWELEKRIIGLRLIDVSHSGENIAERVHAVVDEFKLTDKTFSITLDNASANSTAMTILTPLLSGYIGDMFLHQRCACHIINLIVKSGLKRLKPYLEAFRTAISFLNSSNQRIALYKTFCTAMGVRPRKFGLDMDVRWNSTYLMLKHLIPYRSTFDVFIQTHYPKGDGNTPLLTDQHWYIAEKVLTFLEMFYDATCVLSGVYYPTSPLIMHHILQIANHLDAYENDPLLRTVVAPMKTKFLKYWRDIPLPYSFAFILDPRAKLKAQLSEVFNKYDSKFGEVRLQRAPQPSRAATTNASFGIVSELSTYLDNVLTVPVSTISSESAFSLTSRIIEERRRRLNPEMVEMLTCIKDWEEGEARAQHTAEDKELEDSFSNLFLDDVAQEA
ncbi:hypothetical protein U9M48_042575 [Paspalum notatum var. saurae]|uniref:BED-type domain-containing protein n=1 Tax=Paspalum notatum var. saurae TaxID=547442 RepID=A0AAQ3UQU0_PASNO